MIATRHIASLLVVLGLQMAAFAASAAEVFWQSFDTLGAGDRALAEAALSDMFGDDPDLWPDWLDPRAVLIPAGRVGTLLVVREPYRAPCGQYLFTVFGPPGPQGGRERMGPGFCAGELSVAPMRGRDRPDLIFSEGHRQDSADGLWQRIDQRVRWTGTEWVQIIQK
jgi:hypothetical protein